MNGGFLREQHGMIFVWESYGKVATSLFQHVFIPKKQTTSRRNVMPYYYIAHVTEYACLSDQNFGSF
jgi:hypothetical protein